MNTSNYPSSVPYYISSVVLSSSPSVVPSTFLSVKSSLVLSLLSISSQYNGPSEAPSIKLSNLLSVVPPIEPYNNHISVLLNAPSSSMSMAPSCVPNFSHSGDLVCQPLLLSSSRVSTYPSQDADNKPSTLSSSLQSADHVGGNISFT